MIKWRKVLNHRVSPVSKRLKQVCDLRPVQIAPLLSFGWVSTALTTQTLRLNLGQIDGRSLWAIPLARRQQLKPVLSRQFFSILAQWKRQGFIHGDLSPRNILIKEDPDIDTQCTLWFIDWIVDLNSYEATPQFASREIYLGQRSFASDRFAAEEILKTF